MTLAFALRFNGNELDAAALITGRAAQRRLEHLDGEAGADVSGQGADRDARVMITHQTGDGEHVVREQEREWSGIARHAVRILFSCATEARPGRRVKKGSQ